MKMKALDDPCEKPCKILYRELYERAIIILATTDINRTRKIFIMLGRAEFQNHQ